MIREDIQDRGWTDTLIKRFLAAPCRTKPSPHYASAMPMRLYSPGRVSAIEASPEFAPFLEKVASRRQVRERVRQVALERARKHWEREERRRNAERKKDTPR